MIPRALGAVCLLFLQLAAQSQFTIDADTRTGLEVTIYNSNIGLVKDTRSFYLTRSGQMEVLLEDVAAKVQAETVLPVSQTPQREWVVLEQNYEYDLLTPNTLLAKYVGQPVRLLTYDSDNKVVDQQTATLLSLNEGPLYQVEKEIHIKHPGHVILPEVPKELVARPSLRWLVEGDMGRHTIQVSYLSGGLTWKADYVLKVNQAANSGDLTGWITLNNQSGIAYPEALVKLVAGDVHRAPPERRYPPVQARMELARVRPPEVTEEAFMEYHLYTIPWKTTLKHNQQKQVELLNRSGLNLERHYLADVPASFVAGSRKGESKLPVNVRLLFANTQANHLGDPLPGGIIRIYSEDQAGTLQFAGEDRIEHTPRDEEVEVTLGRAFDLVCEVKQTGYEDLSDRVTRRYESGFEVSLRNRKEQETVTISVLAHFPGEWQIRDSSHDYVQEYAFTARFSVEVPAGQEVILSYSVRGTL
ncbi:MAG: DUF4139 domain-containing protein [Fidelibacterota bacterium]|nr:MAG: DUF4139 domain-containing protein [Candidatus Neomarinimicrobiota bacterium]